MHKEIERGGLNLFAVTKITHCESIYIERERQIFHQNYFQIFKKHSTSIKSIEMHVT